MRLDTIIIMPPYAAAAAAILDNAMGVVHFGQAREEADDGSRRRQWAAMELTSFFAVNYYRRRESERRRQAGKGRVCVVASANRPTWPLLIDWTPLLSPHTVGGFQTLKERAVQIRNTNAYSNLSTAG